MVKIFTISTLSWRSAKIHRSGHIACWNRKHLHPIGKWLLPPPLPRVPTLFSWFLSQDPLPPLHSPVAKGLTRRTEGLVPAPLLAHGYLYHNSCRILHCRLCLPSLKQSSSPRLLDFVRGSRDWEQLMDFVIFSCFDAVLEASSFFGGGGGSGGGTSYTFPECPCETLDCKEWPLGSPQYGRLFIGTDVPLSVTAYEVSPWLCTTLCPALPRSWGLGCQSYNAIIARHINLSAYRLHHCKQVLGITLGKNVFEKVLELSLKKYFRHKMLVLSQGIYGEDIWIKWCRMAV